MACNLKVSDAWIREAPPGLMSVAGYALLENDGNKPLQIVKLQSSAFTEVRMHETRIETGIASMRSINTLDIAAHQQVTFAPSGKHFMLVNAVQPLKNGDVVSVEFVDQTSCVTTAEFTVRRTN